MSIFLAIVETLLVIVIGWVCISNGITNGWEIDMALGLSWLGFMMGIGVALQGWGNVMNDREKARK